VILGVLYLFGLSYYICLLVVLLRFKLAGNGLALGLVADFGALHCQYTTKVDAR